MGNRGGDECKGPKGKYNRMSTRDVGMNTDGENILWGSLWIHLSGVRMEAIKKLNPPFQGKNIREPQNQPSVNHSLGLHKSYNTLFL